jgi:hypothetical protein
MIGGIRRSNPQLNSIDPGANRFDEQTLNER